MPNVTPKVELELSGRGAGWTAITADVLSSIRISYGIRGAGPVDRTASAGSCSFSLNNSARNSAATLGYYSPGGPSVRAGFVLGIRVRVQFQDPATTTWHVKFIGSIVSLVPVAGAYGPRAVQVVAADWIDEAARATVAGLATQMNKRSDEIISLLIGNVPRSPESQLIDTGRETFAYALDTARDDKPNPVLQEIARVTLSELGYFYVKGNGQATFEARADRINQTDAATFTNSMTDLGVTATRDNLLTRVQVVAHPRVVDTATVVLYRLQSSTKIDAGQTVTLLGPYTDPNDRASRVGGYDMVTPVAVTDYTFNSAADGSGTDLTASLMVVASLGGNGVRWELTNTSTTTGYVTKLQARGKGIYDYENTVAEAENTSLLASYGEQVANLDLPYLNNPAVGSDIALYTLGLYGSPLNVAAMSIAPSTAALQTQILARDVGDRIALAETVTGVAASYYIQSVDLDVVAPGIPRVTWGLAPADTTVYWALGVANFSELGESTRLSF